jgi:hypothetical protein
MSGTVCQHIFAHLPTHREAFPNHGQPFETGTGDRFDILDVPRRVSRPFPDTRMAIFNTYNHSWPGIPAGRSTSRLRRRLVSLAEEAFDGVEPGRSR